MNCEGIHIPTTCRGKTYAMAENLQELRGGKFTEQEVLDLVKRIRDNPNCAWGVESGEIKSHKIIQE